MPPTVRARLLSPFSYGASELLPLFCWPYFLSLLSPLYAPRGGPASSPPLFPFLPPKVKGRLLSPLFPARFSFLIKFPTSAGEGA